MASDGNPGLGGRVAENSGINPTVLLTLSMLETAV